MTARQGTMDSKPAPTCELRFHGDLYDVFCRHSLGTPPIIHYQLNRRAAIKDIVEAVGVPHTEIGRIHRSGYDLTFSYTPGGGDILDIEPMKYPGFFEPSALRLEPLASLSFLADATVGKLGRLLRMAGFDTVTPPGQCSERQTALSAARDRRIILTRNRALLRISAVTFGRLLRSQDSEAQLREVDTLFGLRTRMRPFTRCLMCNDQLEKIEKMVVIGRLEPLTKRYYHSFSRCPGCDRIYWQGSHHRHMDDTLRRAFAMPGERL